MSIAANKVRGIRCAHCTDVFCAEVTRQHNDSNMIAMGTRISSPEDIIKMTLIFLKTDFSGEERHKRRVEKIEKF